MAEVMTARDGRKLAYLGVGDPTGPLVLHNHGAPTNKLRLICVDGPGMGQSSAQKSRCYACDFVAVGAADEIFAIAATELDVS